MSAPSVSVLDESVAGEDITRRDWLTPSGDRPKAPQSHAALRPTETEPSGDGDSTVIFKALQILDSFEGANAPLGVSELARIAGLPKSTTFRMLRQLLDSGYVSRIGTKYRLSRRLFELGNQILECGPTGLRDTALPYLGELYHQARQVVHMAVLDGTDVLYLEKIQGVRAVPVPTSVGARTPAATTAVGKALLAFCPPDVVRATVDRGLVRRTRYSIIAPGRLAQQLAQVRQTGIAYDNEESALGLRCVAAPVMSNGRVVAAVSVSGSSGCFGEATLARLVERTAQNIATELPRTSG